MATRTFKFDFVTFDDLYSHNVTASGSGGSGYTGVLNAVASNTDLIVRLLRNNNSTSNYSISLRIYVIGKGSLIDSYGWVDVE